MRIGGEMRTIRAALCILYQEHEIDTKKYKQSIDSGWVVPCVDTIGWVGFVSWWVGLGWVKKK